MARITYELANPRTVDCETLIQTWVLAAKQKDNEHHAYLMRNGFQIAAIRQIEADILKNKLDTNAFRYTLFTAMAVPEKAPEQEPQCVGYLLAFEENFFSVKIERACSQKTCVINSTGEKENIESEKIGTNLFKHYAQNLKDKLPDMSIDTVSVDAHKGSIPFWKKIGLKTTGFTRIVNNMEICEMTMKKNVLSHWREKGCAPA